MAKKQQTNELVPTHSISAYTRRRLEQLTESQLEAKSIIIRSGSLKEQLFCHYSYDHKVASNTTNSVTIKSQVPVHSDLIDRFKDLHVHLAVICEEISPESIPDIDNLPVYDPDPDLTELDQHPLALSLHRFSVSSFKIVGEGENEGVALTGEKRLSTGEYVSLSTPVVRWHGEYPFVNELHVAIFNLVEEIEAYMKGKQAPQRQTELDFGEGIDDAEFEEE
jgi:hypothetical protein